MVLNFLTKVFGSKNERELKQMQPLVDRINTLEPEIQALNDEQLNEQLWNTIQKLYDVRIVLDFTDHLSDRQLYTLIFRDILPSAEKKIDLPKMAEATGIRILGPPQACLPLIKPTFG